MPSATGGLEAQSLEKRFGSVTAVADVSIEVRPGEIVGLLGPNGAGKTTTLRMLAGILSPDRGRVAVDGIDLQLDPIGAKRRIGFLSGDTQLYQRLTPREVLTYFGRLYELDASRIDERSRTLIAELDMSAYADRACGTLSSGHGTSREICRLYYR
jgi:sodium transport system ATP-binding protein